MNTKVELSLDPTAAVETPETPESSSTMPETFSALRGRVAWLEMERERLQEQLKVLQVARDNLTGENKLLRFEVSQLQKSLQAARKAKRPKFIRMLSRGISIPAYALLGMARLCRAIGEAILRFTE